MWLGIDFGTSYSSATLVLNGELKSVKDPTNPYQGYSFPSSIFVTEKGEILVGQAAENARQKDPKCYRREFKRDLGSSEPYMLGKYVMLPEDLIAEVLKKLKNEAERMVEGQQEGLITHTILTIPATYQTYKRQLIEDAARKVGFQEIELLEEPVAAANYYAHKARVEDGDIILVYDLGGGTFDATLIEKCGSDFRVLGTPKGLPQCGGSDFDREIYQLLRSKVSSDLRQQLEAKDAWAAKAIVSDLCRDLKHQLSQEQEASIFIPIGLGRQEPFSLTRDTFNGLIAPLVEETVECCDQLLRGTNLDWQRLSQVLLVGGSCRIPYVRESLTQKLGKSPWLVDEPELAVCLGAAIFGAAKSPESALTPMSGITPVSAQVREPDSINTIPVEGIITVSANGGNDYLTIGEAIQNAQPNTQIRVLPGIYQENIVINKSIEIVGEGVAGAVVLQSSENTCITMQTEIAVVRHLTVRCLESKKESKFFAVDIASGQLILEDCDVSSDALAGISIHGSGTNAIIRNCKIHNCKKAGIRTYEMGKGLIEKCEIFANYSGIDTSLESDFIVHNCKIYNCKCGISVIGKTKITIDSCEVFSNDLPGIQITEEANPTVRYCKIYHGKSDGILVYKKGQGLIESCEIFENNHQGINIQSESNPTIRYCKLYDSKQTGIKVESKSQGIIENCEIFANDFAGIQINEEANPTIRFSKIHNCKGGILATNKGQALIESCEIFANTAEGILIQKGGNLTVYDCKVYDEKQQPGIFVREGILSASNCKIFDNYRGIFIDKKSQVLVESCDIYSNSVDQAIIFNEGKLTLRKCQIYDGKNWGVVVSGGEAIMESSNIFSNGNSGIHVDYGGSSSIRNCKIQNNDGCGVFLRGDSQINIENCQICDNNLNPQSQMWQYLGGLPGHRKNFLGFNTGVNSVVAFLDSSSDTELFASAGDDGTIKLWDISSGNPKSLTLEGHNAKVTAVASSSEYLFSGGYDKTIRVWYWSEDSKNFENRAFQGHSGNVYAVAASPNEEIIASGSEDRTIKLWQFNGEEKFTLLGHTGSVNTVAFSPDGGLLASGSSDNTIKLWRVNSGKIVRTLSGHSGSICSVAFSPDGEVLASGSEDKTIKLWHVDTGQLVRTISGNKGSVRSVAFSPDGKLLASGSNDKVVILWLVSTGQQFMLFENFNKNVRSVAFNSDGSKLIYGGDGNIIPIWQMTRL